MQSSSILTLVACRRAKEKRERLRSAHLAPDYVPLGGAAGLTASSNQQAAARLRGQADEEGANSEEDPDEEDGIRMQFVGGTRPVKSRPAQQAGEGQVSSEDAMETKPLYSPWKVVTLGFKSAAGFVVQNRAMRHVYRTS